MSTPCQAINLEHYNSLHKCHDGMATTNGQPNAFAAATAHRLDVRSSMRIQRSKCSKVTSTLHEAKALQA